MQVDSEAHAQWFADYTIARRGTAAGSLDLDKMVRCKTRAFALLTSHKPKLKVLKSLQIKDVLRIDVNACYQVLVGVD